MMGLTKVENGVTLEEIKRPWMKAPLEVSANQLSATEAP